MTSKTQFYNSLKNSLLAIYDANDVDLICTEVVILMKSSEPENFSSGMALLATYNKNLLIHPFVAQCYKAYFECDY